ncbi:ead/Ea22-like family protein [Enterobacter hormaechei]|uniref:ead/Ea22-like family protein n=1 Tax=Enterobacter hormaechei TaxID=158836 RepID=UPI000F841185|nr:ead/Ea22-like family protein [Enterobacter hormaechei]RTP50968.1 ead/Ea22-like family protein [Enterobacter hormaechei]
MSNIDKRALRVLATALDGDDWHAEGNSVYGGRYDVGDNVCYDHIASCESVNGKSPHADFIAAANPATVLALLNELEAAEKLIAEHRETLLAARSHVMHCARLGDAHASGVLQAIDRAAADKGAAS